jgi:ribulose-phosphate 3-epimerase
MIDVHLMVEPVDDLVPAFARAGAGSISFHPEASRHVDRTIRLIREHGCGVGLALNPGTPLAWLDEVIGDLDVVLLMSVNPGYGGQAFIARTLDRLRRVRERIAQTERDSGHHVRLQIDGGVKTDNIAAIARAGAEVFVAGSAIFGAPHYAEVVATLKRLASAQRAVAP